VSDVKMNEHALDVVERGEPYDLDLGCVVLIDNEHRTDLASSDNIWIELRLALAHIRDLRATVAAMGAVVEAAEGLHDKADKCVDRPWMGCAIDHGTVLSWLDEVVPNYRAAKARESK
jgi:hypothetical protein